MRLDTYSLPATERGEGRRDAAAVNPFLTINRRKKLLNAANPQCRLSLRLTGRYPWTPVRCCDFPKRWPCGRRLDVW